MKIFSRNFLLDNWLTLLDLLAIGKWHSICLYDVTQYHDFSNRRSSHEIPFVNGIPGRIRSGVFAGS
jgi:hypothetical protein